MWHQQWGDPHRGCRGHPHMWPPAVGRAPPNVAATRAITAIRDPLGNHLESPHLDHLDSLEPESEMGRCNTAHRAAPPCTAKCGRHEGHWDNPRSIWNPPRIASFRIPAGTAQNLTARCAATHRHRTAAHHGAPRRTTASCK